MDDNSTRMLKRPEAAPDNSTRVFRAPPQTPAPVKRRAPAALRVLWGLVRFGVVCLSLLVIAQSLAALISNPWIDWGLALLSGAVVPVAALLWLRRTLKRRTPNARVRISLFSWGFGWNFLLSLVLFLSLPGILTLAVGTQGSALARVLAGATAPDHLLPRAVHWLAGVTASGLEAVETRAFGEQAVAPRVAAAKQALGQELVQLPAVNAVAVPIPTIDGAGPVASSGSSPGVGPGDGDGGSGPATGGPGGEGSLLPGSGVPGASTGADAGVGPAAGGTVGVVGNGPGSGISGVPGASGLPMGSSAAGSSSVPLAGAAASGNLVRPGTGASSALSGVPGNGAVPVPLPAGSSVPGMMSRAALVEVPFHREGNAVVVDVVIDRRYPARMLLDTGASYTTLSPAVLQRLGLAPSPTAPIISTNTARGQRQDTLTVADTFALGGLELSGVAILRCDDCASGEHDGLLGMNVLSNFAVNIDQEHGVIRLEDKRAKGDQRMDISPFVAVEAVPEASSLPLQPFFVTATNRAPRAVPTLSARLTLLNENRAVVATHIVKLPPLPAGQQSSVRAEVPREPPYVYYQVELADAHW